MVGHLWCSYGNPVTGIQTPDTPGAPGHLALWHRIYTYSLEHKNKPKDISFLKKKKEALKSVYNAKYDAKTVSLNIWYADWKCIGENAGFVDNRQNHREKLQLIAEA